MNTRLVIIILALTAPIATLAFMTNQAEVLPKPRENPENNAAKAKKMNPDGTPHTMPMALRPRPPASLEEAKSRLKRKLADLEKMTPEEWAQQQRQKMDDVMNIRPQPLQPESSAEQKPDTAATAAATKEEKRATEVTPEGAHSETTAPDSQLAPASGGESQ